MNKKTMTKGMIVIILGLASVYVYRPRSSHPTIEPRGFETFALAKSMVEHRGFSDPFQPMSTGPSAHLPPLYPAFLALVMRVFGNGAVGANIIIWSAALMLAAQLMLLPSLAESLGLGFATGVVASLGWLAAGIPPIFLWESTATGLLVVAAAFLMGKSFSREMSTSEILLSGLLWGALLLLQPVVLVVLLPWLMLLRFRSKIPPRQIIALGLLPVLIIAPWIVRNWMAFHRPVFIRDNFGLELSVSNNPCASALFEVNDLNGCWAQSHPNYSYAEAQLVRAMGEADYNRMKLREAMNWIGENPAKFADLSGQRFLAFWVPPHSLNKGNGMIWRPFGVQLFTLLSLPGLFLMWRNSRTAAFVLGLWLMFFPLIYYFIQFMDRYRYPIFWASFLAGSCFLTEVTRGLAGARRAPVE